MSSGLRFWRAVAASMTTCALLMATPSAFAADNTATGDVAGDNSALANSAVFQLFSTGSALQLVKRAFLADGTPITSGSTVPTGTTVKFMIYVSNASSIAINDVSMQDVLDPLFTFQTGTIKIDNSTANCAAAACTPAEEAAMFAAVDGSAALSDAVDADAVSFTAGTTVDAGNQAQANAQLNVAATSSLAMLFNVTVN